MAMKMNLGFSVAAPVRLAKDEASLHAELMGGELLK